MKICVAQIQSIKGAVATNIQHHLEFVKQAIQLGAKAIFFPELSITNYEPSLANELAVNMHDDQFDPFQQQADFGNITIGIGMPTKSQSGTRISMIVFQPNRNRSVYSKQHLHEDELPYFVGGTDQLILDVGETKIAIGICYESLQREHFVEAHLGGMDVYISSVAKPAHGIEKAHQYFPTTANEFKTPILMSNSIGNCDNFLSTGQSTVWDDAGQRLAMMDGDSEGLLLYDLETNTAEIFHPLEHLSTFEKEL